MRTRFWIALLACATLIPASGCGSCRWGRKHGVLPYQCVDPHCDDPACEVCSPVPPLYDGWANHRYMRNSGCGCGGMPCGGMPCGDACGSCCEGGMVMGDCGSCGGCPDGMVMDGSCSMSGNSCGMPMMGEGTICPHCHQSSSMPPQEPATHIPNGALESAPPYSPGPAESPAHGPTPAPAPGEPMSGTPAASGNTTLYSPPSEIYSETSPAAVPAPIPSVPAESLAPEPPVATPTSAARPSNYFYAPNKPLTKLAAPRPVTGPVHLAPPPAAQWETSLEIAPVEPASMAVPELPSTSN